MRLEHIAAHGRTVALLGAGLLWAATLDCLAANGENGAAASGAKQCAAPGALQTQPSPADCTLCVRNNPLIIAGADGTASATLQLCNKGPDKKLQLSVEDFRAYSPRGATFPLGATRTLNAELASQQDIREGKAPLATDTCIGLKLDAAKLNAAGSMSSALWNGDERLIDLKAVRYQVPFNLKVDGGTGEAVAVAINGADAAGHIALRNEDPIAYCVSWRLELDGRVDSHDVIVPAGGSVDLPFKLRNGRLSWLDSGFLRTATQSGRLILRHQPDESFSVYPMAQKIYPVTAHWSYYSGPGQKFANSVFVLLLLLVGIIGSLLISHALPMQRRRVAIKQRLADQEGRLAGLGELFNHRVLSLLRIEKRRLREALRGLSPVMPTVEAPLKALEERVDWLEKRIDLTVRTGEQLAAIKLDDGLAVQEADTVRTCCREVLEIVEKPMPTADDLKSAEAQLQQAFNVLAAGDLDPQPAAVQALLDQAQQVAVPTEPIATQLGLKPLYELFAGLQPQIPRTAAALARRENYVRASRAVAKAQLVSEYFAAVQGATAAVQASRVARQQELVDSLTPGPNESLRCAQSIVRQVIQNVSVADVIREVRNSAGNALRIEVDPRTPIPLQLVILRVRMDRPGLDTADARLGIECHWKVIEHEWKDTESTPQDTECKPTVQVLETSGWTIGHYFENPEIRLGFRFGWLAGRRWLRRLTPREPVIVEATLSHPDLPQPVLLPRQHVQLELPKTYSSMQLWLSLTSIVITLVILGLGMQAGAQEKIQSLDWVSAVMVLVALGFGADALKQLLARSS